MTTRLMTAGAVLVLAIVFGFVFWNQFTSNQHQLAGDNSNQAMTTSTSTDKVSQQSSAPANDNTASIESDLNSLDINGIDSDSSQLNSNLSGF